ncbi:DinB family protein [Noviherbaspirillum saxi]|uniref:DinB family protein n=1 Tax=Noviherbaspirillum saxi TaxID=2320863 RepID=A0A3A3FFI1_9BURK|nr:DinB family protein [Noviherbaspirillum saxi]RJF92010.1 DinB family protein [Noviherbaspirillum saxi]
MNQATISALEAFPAQFEQFFLAIPKSHWNWAPESWDGIPSESFTAIEQVCHVRDIEIDGYHVRFRRLLSESNPTLDSIDGYALAKERRYADADPAKMFEEIRAARRETVQLLQNLTPEQLARSGYFEGYGRLTVKGLMHYLCSHDQQHLSGLQWLLGKIDSHARTKAA